MGCGQSKIENEEAVTRCKERKQFMKEAVSCRNAFAAAHSAYAMSLKNTGAALSDFAHGEVINPNYHPITTTTTATTTIHQSLPSTSASVSTPPPPPHPDNILPPPPPPSSSSPFPPTTSPLHRAASMPEMKLPLKPENNHVGPTTIIEEEDVDEVEIETEKLVSRKRGSRREREVENSNPPPTTTPPPPPVVVMTSASPPPMQGVHDSKWAEYSDYIFQPQESMMGPGLTAVEEEEKVFDERPKRGVESVVVEEVRKSVKVPVPVPVVEVVAEKEKEKVAVVDSVPVVVGGGGGSVGKSFKKGKGGGERRGAVKGSVNLLQIFAELDDHFLKASESAHEVSKMLEAARLHYHSNFADNRGNHLRLRYIINWNNDDMKLWNSDSDADNWNNDLRVNKRIFLEFRD